MCKYLDTTIDLDDPEVISAMDDLPLWSAPFGLMLLERVRIRPHSKALDVGFGSGFPLLELAQSLGSTSTVSGIDPWSAAHERVRQKIKIFNLTNVKLFRGDASAMPFKDDIFDLIVSNLGINNFNDPQKVLAECFRVAKPKAQIILTTNPKGHMQEFYETFEKVLGDLGNGQVRDDFFRHVDHRLTAEMISRHLMDLGFKKISIYKSTFALRFLNGSAFFWHPLIRYGFLDDWKALFPDRDRQRVFQTLEDSLNRLAEKNGELRLTIPLACIEGEK